MRLSRKCKAFKDAWSKVERIKIKGFFYGKGKGNGDWGHDNARKIIEDEDQSQDAHRRLEKIFETLWSGKRWPDEFDYLITTTNHTQTDITKDGFILCYACAVYLNRYDLINANPPPTCNKNRKHLVQKKWRKWSYFLPNEYAWYKELIGESKAYSRFWRWVTPYFILPAHTYVLYGFMEQAYKQAKEKYD
jgi:hypothetical protein